MPARWFWSLRWHIGGRMLLWATYVLPPSAPRSSLCCHVNDWSREWDQRMREAKQQELRDDIQRTTASWQAEV